MNRSIQLIWFMLIALLLSMLLFISQATATPPPLGSIVEEPETAVFSNDTTVESAPAPYLTNSDASLRQQNGRSLETFALNQPSFRQTPNQTINGAEVVCQEMLLNNEMNFAVFPDNTANVDPWIEVVELLYFSRVGSPISPDFSLVLVDADTADTATPTEDSFGQGFTTPDNLQQIQVRYSVRTRFNNDLDNARGEIWLLDDEFRLDELHGSWSIVETDNEEWVLDSGVNINPNNNLATLQNTNVAILIVSETDGVSNPNNANINGEAVYIDDLSLVACYLPTGTDAYLPFMSRAMPNPEPPQPRCLPPDEPDSAFNSQGRIELDSSCTATLSSSNLRDYYLFTPTESGNYTMRLQGLPQASANAFRNVANLPFVEAVGGGDCAFTQAAADRSITCRFTANNEYLILVNFGSSPNSGQYTLSISE